jgi:hypothetical protein
VLAVLLAFVVAGCDDGEKKQAAATATATATTGAATTSEQPEGPPPPSQYFVSRPDLKPPVVKIRTPANGTAPGYIFLGPKMVVAQAGPMIMDNKGQVVWFHPLKKTKGITDFRVQRYKGKPVLTWWRGRVSEVGVGNGWFVIYDQSYRPVAEVRPGKGFAGDVHEFLITPRDTALILIYHRLRVDLTSIGGPKKGLIWDGIVQEIDIPTGRVLFEWHSYPQIGIKESYSDPPKKQLGTKPFPYDYVHLNSIAEGPDGNLLISGRNTHAVYKVSRKTGKVLWRLGGKQSDFKLGEGVRFAWQHDARWQPDGTMTIFDNGAAPPVHKFSRVLVLRVDSNTKQAALVRSYSHPKKLLAPFEGNAQFLPDGHIFVGWGAFPNVTEQLPDGRVIFQADFGQGKKPGEDADTYRAYRLPWQGKPLNRPAIAATKLVNGQVTVYASWNGATDVAQWRVLAGDDRDQLKPVGTFRKTGFETGVNVPDTAKMYAVAALRADGTTIRRSFPIEP